jgi:hypothetical protein
MTTPPATRSGLWAARSSSAVGPSAAWSGAVDGPGAGGEKLVGQVAGHGLDVPGEADRPRPRLGRDRKHPHRAEEGVGDLFGAFDPVKESGHGAERVVHRHVREPRVLELLKDGSATPVASRPFVSRSTGRQLMVADDSDPTASLNIVDSAMRPGPRSRSAGAP